MQQAVLFIHQHESRHQGPLVTILKHDTIAQYLYPSESDTQTHHTTVTLYCDGLCTSFRRLCPFITLDDCDRLHFSIGYGQTLQFTFKLFESPRY